MLKKYRGMELRTVKMILWFRLLLTVPRRAVGGKLLMTANAFRTAASLNAVVPVLFLRGDTSSTVHRHPLGLAVWTTV